jgi:tRNA nucleotidyltransferase/poly(A) polymerase
MAPLRNIKIDATFPTMELKGELMKTTLPSTSHAAKTSTLPTPAKIPKAVLQACKKLSSEGFKAWLAGGCVRDAVLNRKPKDWDIVTNAPLEKIREYFPDHLEVGAVFGIVKLPMTGTKADPVNIDIAIFRRESSYSDYRHPDAVEPGDEASDVARRDFTINAMYLDPVAHTVIDYVGGMRDIAAKQIKTVGQASARFSEDALRLLRAVRFAAQLGFKLDRETAGAIRKCAPLLKNISRERVREEVMRMLSTPRPVMGLEAIAQNGLWELVFGVRRVSLPADLRQLRLSWTPEPFHWLCAMGVTGLLGDPIREPEAIMERLTELLRLANVEKRVLGRIIHVYGDSSREPTAARACEPMDWVTLAREDKQLIDLIKSFVRRARGPTEKEKADAIALLEQTQRWAAKAGSEKRWPSSQTLIKEGFEPGPKLGQELRQRQWAAFWATRP